VTHCQMVPVMFNRLLRLSDEVRGRYDTSSLERIVHAAAPCPVHVKQAMIDWLGPIITEYYGATEANGFTFCTTAEWLAHPGTVGRPSSENCSFWIARARSARPGWWTGLSGSVARPRSSTSRIR
jgi:acyl-CoA synthetase (AMP-forming)/AMP-acid ligase II